MSSPEIVQKSNHVVLSYYFPKVRTALVKVKRKNKTIFVRRFSVLDSYAFESRFETCITTYGSILALISDGEFHVYDLLLDEEIFMCYFGCKPVSIRGTLDNRYILIYCTNDYFDREFHLFDIEKKEIVKRRKLKGSIIDADFSDDLVHHTYHIPAGGVLNNRDVYLDSELIHKTCGHVSLYFSSDSKYLVVATNTVVTVFDVKTKDVFMNIVLDEPAYTLVDLFGRILVNTNGFYYIDFAEKKLLPAGTGIRLFGEINHDKNIKMGSHYMAKLFLNDGEFENCFLDDANMGLRLGGPPMLHDGFHIYCPDYDLVLSMMPTIRVLYSLQRAFPLIFPNGVLEHITKYLIENNNKKLIRMLLELAANKVFLNRGALIMRVLPHL